MKKQRVVTLILIMLCILINTLHAQKNESRKVKHKEVTFNKGKTIEVILFSPKSEMKSELDAYLNTVKPIALEYGGKLLILFKVNSNANTGVKMIGIEEWTSLEKKRAFLQDERILKLLNKRNIALDYFTSGLLQVKETTTYNFREDKAYDIACLWFKKDKVNQEKFAKYYGTVVPAAIKTRDYKSVVSFTGIPDVYDQSYHPDVFGIGEWPNRDSFNDFVNSKLFKDVAHLRAESLKNLDFFMVEPVID